MFSLSYQSKKRKKDTNNKQSQAQREVEEKKETKHARTWCHVQAADGKVDDGVVLFLEKVILQAERESE